MGEIFPMPSTSIVWVTRGATFLAKSPEKWRGIKRSAHQVFYASSGEGLSWGEELLLGFPVGSPGRWNVWERT